MLKPDFFLERFLAPLVEGGAVHVGAPLGAAGLARLCDTIKQLDPALVARIADARASVAAVLLLDPIPPPLDVAALRLAVALHDLLFLLHPGAGGTLVRNKRMAAVAEHATTIARLPPTSDADDLVARHTVLHAFPTMGRTDVLVSFWAGKQEFQGSEPPRRLLAWPGVRRVRQERRRVACFADTATHPLGAPVVRALLDGSPLTDLLHPARAEPRFAFRAVAGVLRLPEICRLAAYTFLEEGIQRTGGALAQAMLAELEASERERTRLVLSFLAHLHLCLVLAPGPREEQTETLRVTVAGDPALRDFYGLYPALRLIAPELAAPGDVRRDRRLEGAVARHAAACEAACGQNRVAELAAQVAAALELKLLGAGTETGPPGSDLREESPRAGAA